MIIKILKSAANFEGVDYSERKNDKGVSELLTAKNFEGMMLGVNEAKKDLESRRNGHQMPGMRDIEIDKSN